MKYQLNDLEGVQDADPVSIVDAIHMYVTPEEIAKTLPSSGGGGGEPVKYPHAIDPNVLEMNRLEEAASLVSSKMKQSKYLAAHTESLHHFYPLFKTYPKIAKLVFDDRLAYIKTNKDHFAKTQNGSSSCSCSSSSSSDD